MALILLNSCGMRTTLYVLGITITLCTLAPTAMAACPLSAGNTTTWTIDSTSTDEAMSTCLEPSGGDCALSAVATKINEILFLQSQCKTALDAGDFKTATLKTVR